MPKCDSFCSASFGNKSNSDGRMVMGEWSGGDDDAYNEYCCMHVFYRFTVAPFEGRVRTDGVGEGVTEFL